MAERLDIGDICNRVVVFTTEDMTVKQAAELMRDEHVGSLVVIRDADLGRIVVGMVTDRDIAIVAVARDFEPQTLRVADIMNSPAITTRPDASVNEVLGLMRQHGIRRVPVTSDQGVLIGIITLDDLLEIFAEEMQVFVQAMTAGRHHEARTRV
ncbi:CBS domain-containing protein [Noviherbaspirillum massiliense]|uniref:CBS domain-containing protein n=1 Tax=Noviherbaspirillum massiliense TaxID=1465823 RepID=UPI0002F0D2D8|nr:CBS domain-containing protein [Noviherbaspirillum massiliense]